MISDTKIFLFITSDKWRSKILTMYKLIVWTLYKSLLIKKKKNGYIEEDTGNKFLTLVPTDKSKETLKKMKNYEKN